MASVLSEWDTGGSPAMQKTSMFKKENDGTPDTYINKQLFDGWDDDSADQRAISQLVIELISAVTWWKVSES